MTNFRWSGKGVRPEENNGLPRVKSPKLPTRFREEPFSLSAGRWFWTSPKLGVGFVSLTEALDLTTSTGRAMAGLLAVFAEFEREVLRERIRAGIAQAREGGRPPRPPADGVAEGGRGPAAQGRAGEPLRDRAAAGDRPDLGAEDPRRRLRAVRPALGSCAASRVTFTGRVQRSGNPRKARTPGRDRLAPPPTRPEPHWF